MTTPLTQAEIERRIIETVDALDELTHDYAETGRRAAAAEAGYRRQKAMMTLAVIEHPPEGKRLDAKARDARIDLASQDDHEAHLFAAADVDAQREALRAHRTRLDALRTLAANVRAQT